MTWSANRKDAEVYLDLRENYQKLLGVHTKRSQTSVLW